MKSLNRVYVIAEIGVNHNGSYDLAKELVTKAYEAGVDAVKFQTFKADKLLAKKDIKKAPYQVREKSDNQYEMLKRLELDLDDLNKLKDYCKELKIDFMSTPYDSDSVKALKAMGVDTVKVASADIINRALLDNIIDEGLNMIVSVGMASYEEISRTIKYVKERNSQINIGLLHCTTSYPTDFEDVHMNVMLKLDDMFGDLVEIGYSDHTVGVEVPVMAVSMGAKIIEKHFTLDRNMDGPDHFASAEPEELKQMVSYIRNIEKSFGKDSKELTDTEKVNIKVMRRSVHLKDSLEVGDVISEDNITFTRPYDGHEIWNYEDLLGKKLKRNLSAGSPLNKEDLE